MKLEDAGEFELIDRIAQLIGPAPQLILGIGDDACAWQNTGEIALATVDTLVEGVHFERYLTTWYQLGWKALSVNLSDLAAMGANAGIALVALNLPGSVEVEDVLEMYRGMLELGREFNVQIAGGNISKADCISITVTAGGSAGSAGRLLLRSNARPGDVIAVTGFPGSAAAGLELLKGKTCPRQADASLLKQAFLKPYPRLREGRQAVELGIDCAIDISDGLLADLKHVLRSSNVNAIVDVGSLPVRRLMEASFTHTRAVEMALTGGEDYELLFTCKRTSAADITRRTDIPVTVIGKIIEGAGAEIELTGDIPPDLDLKIGGWQHFGR